MSDEIIKHRKIIHMAGIVPVAGPRLDFKCPWNDALMPIAPDYLAVERAVYECALAGCETIWVICRLGTEPLLRKKIGDYIYDPVSLTISINPSLRSRKISVFYIPIKPRDKNRRESVGWSLLYAADTIFRVSAHLSNWVVPRKYYCAFPHGIMPEDVIWKNRKKISMSERTVFTWNGKTVKDDLPISFTFDEEHFKIFRDQFKQNQALYRSGELDEKPINFSLSNIFSRLELFPDEMITIPWFYDIRSWDKYVSFLNSEEGKNIQKNKECFLRIKRVMFPTPDERHNIMKLNRQSDTTDPDSIEET